MSRQKRYAQFEILRLQDSSMTLSITKNNLRSLQAKYTSASKNTLHEERRRGTPEKFHQLLELIRNKRDSVRKAREAYLINKAKTLHALGINRVRRDDTSHTCNLVLNNQSLSRIFIFKPLFAVILLRFSP